MHSETKQIEKSGFGAEQGLLQGHPRKSSFCPKNLNSQKALDKAVLKASGGLVSQE